MLSAIFNISRKQHPTKQKLYGHFIPISQTIQSDEQDMLDTAGDVLLLTPALGCISFGRSAETYIDQLCASIGYGLEDLTGARNDRDGWRERDSRDSMLSARHDDDDDDVKNNILDKYAFHWNTDWTCLAFCFLSFGMLNVNRNFFFESMCPNVNVSRGIPHECCVSGIYSTSAYAQTEIEILISKSLHQRKIQEYSKITDTFWNRFYLYNAIVQGGTIELSS